MMKKMIRTVAAGCLCIPLLTQALVFDSYAEPVPDSQESTNGEAGLAIAMGSYYALIGKTPEAPVESAPVQTPVIPVSSQSVTDTGGKMAKVVGIPALQLYAQPDSGSQVLTLLGEGAEYEILAEDSSGFLKILVDQTLSGYAQRSNLEILQKQSGSPAGSGGPAVSGGPAGSDGSSVSKPEVNTDSPVRAGIVTYSMKFVGNPYLYGGTSLTEGADCSGFTSAVYQEFGYQIGRSSRDQANQGKEIRMDELKPGDLVFYDSAGVINHVAIYAGDTKIVHASTEKTGITISSLYYRTPYKAVTFLE